MSMSLQEELEQLKAERTVLIKQLTVLDERVTLLAQEIQRKRSQDFRQKHDLSVGDVVQLNDAIREFVMGQFIEVGNPLIFTQSNAKVIGYDYDSDVIYLGQDMEDPAPIPVPVSLLVTSQQN